MRLPTLLLSALLGFVHVQVVSAADEAPAATPSFAWVMPGKPESRMDAASLANGPRTSVTAATHDQAPSDWEGVALIDLLRQSGAPVDKQLRGAALATIVRATASDGYQVVFTLAELDAAFGKARVLVADSHDGKPLGAEDGPFRLVVPGDARAGRWLRKLVRIEVLSVRSTPATASH
jgi:DMSO/TMAO reductase YedYZ molybdopterin-dependent catalytic subunit